MRSFPLAAFLALAMVRLASAQALVPGYTVTVPLDPKTGKVPATAFKKAKVAYDDGYDKAAIERMSVQIARSSDSTRRRSGYRSNASSKKVTVEASGNIFSEPSGAIIADTPATWVVAP